MSDTPSKADAFVNGEMAKLENRMVWGAMLGSSLGYLIVTLFLNSIRATASLWVVWPLIIIQFALYFWIFIAGYQRSKALGLNQTAALILFVALAILGRVNDWEVLVIPVLVVAMLLWSTLKSPANALK